MPPERQRPREPLAPNSNPSSSTAPAMPGAVAPTLPAASSCTAAAPNPTARGDPLASRPCRVAAPAPPPLVPLAATSRHVHGCRGAPASLAVATPHHHARNPRHRFAAAAGMAAEASMADAESAGQAKPFAVLFVCLGQSPRPIVSAHPRSVPVRACEPIRVPVADYPCVRAD